MEEDRETKRRRSEERRAWSVFNLGSPAAGCFLRLVPRSSIFRGRRGSIAPRQVLIRNSTYNNISPSISIKYPDTPWLLQSSSLPWAAPPPAPSPTRETYVKTAVARCQRFTSPPYPTLPYPTLPHPSRITGYCTPLTSSGLC